MLEETGKTYTYREDPKWLRLGARARSKDGAIRGVIEGLVTPWNHPRFERFITIRQDYERKLVLFEHEKFLRDFEQDEEPSIFNMLEADPLGFLL